MTVPQGHVEAQLGSSSNSPVVGALINMNPTIVRIYSQNNESIFVMVPNVKAIFIGKSEVASATRIGRINRISPNVTSIIRSNSSIVITNATLISSGNSTLMSIVVRNAGHAAVNLTDMQLEGFMEEIRLGYQGYSSGASGQTDSVNAEKGCFGVLCISNNASLSISEQQHSRNQSELAVSAAEDFVNRFNNYLNFIVLDNGTLSLPIFNYEPDCPEYSNGIGQFIGCRRLTGLTIQPGNTATLHFNSTITIGKATPYSPETTMIFGGITKILLIPGQQYDIKVSGVGQEHSGIAYSNYTTTDNGSTSNYTAKLVGVSYVNEQTKLGNYTYNTTMQGFTSTINGTTNYTIPILGSPVNEYTMYNKYSLKSINVLTQGFALLGTTNITEYVPGKCPVCSGSIHCLVCIAGKNIKAVILTIRSPDYQYYGPLAISAVYSMQQNSSDNSSVNESRMSTITTTTTTTTTIPQNLSDYGTIAGKITISSLCNIGTINYNCTGSIDTNYLSQLKIELNQTNGTSTYAIPVEANGTYSQKVAAGTYSISMLNCHYLSCIRDIPKSVNISAGELTELNISISINAGMID